MAVGSVQIIGTGQLIQVSRQLRAAAGTPVQRALARRIRRAAEPLHRDLQSTIQGLPIRSGGRGAGKRGGTSPTTRPLRATIAGAIRISVRTSSAPGARVWVDKGRLPPDLKNMAQTINTGRIRHPVFGNRRRWSTQTAPPLWWDRTVQRHTPRMSAEVARALNDVARYLS